MAQPINLYFHTLPVELVDNILFELSPKDIVSLLDSMSLHIKFIDRGYFYRSYCHITLKHFFKNYSDMLNTFNILIGRHSSKKKFYRKLFLIIVAAHRVPYGGVNSSIKPNDGWLDRSGHFYYILDNIIEDMVRTFVYQEDRHNIPSVQWSHNWEVSRWQNSSLFPLMFSLLVQYPQLFQNQGQEAYDVIFSCFFKGITFSMIQNRILTLTSSGEEPTFINVFNSELFNDQ
jgi:hypothetical protein